MCWGGTGRALGWLQLAVLGRQAPRSAFQASSLPVRTLKLLSLRPSLPAATNPSEPRTLPCQPFAARGRPSRGNRVLWPLSLTCIACLLGAFWASFAFAPLLGVVRVPHHVVSASPGPIGDVPGAWRAQESRQTPLSLFGN